MSSLCCTTIFAGRVTLKPVSSAYDRAIYREFTEEVAKYTFPKPPDDIEGTRAFIADAREKMDRGTEITVAVIDRSTGNFLGCAGLHRIDTREPEIGIWLAKSAQGQGYGKEVVTALMGWADANLGYDSFVYPVVKENLPSRKLAESLGGTVFGEGKMTDARGGEHDEAIYRIPKRVRG